MWLTHGRAPSQVTTDILGVKGMPQDTKLLGKFFMQMASDTSSNNCNDTFLPKGAVHLLGPQMYEQVLKENIFS